MCAVLLAPGGAVSENGRLGQGAGGAPRGATAAGGASVAYALQIPRVTVALGPGLGRYGQGREYLLLIDRDAGEADPGSYTKCMYRFFQSWYPRYHTASVALVADLPETFLAVDDDYTKTFEWVFAHHPELTKQLLGTHTATHDPKTSRREAGVNLKCLSNPERMA